MNTAKPKCKPLTDEEFNRFANAIGDAFLHGLLHSTPLPLEDLDLKISPITPGTKHIRFRKQNG